MSTFDLGGWRTTTAIALTGILPLQTFETALVLVESYLASIGGWVPDNPQNPTGPGEPVSGETPVEASVTIRDNQYDRVYNLNLQATVRLDLNYVANLSPNQTLNDVLIAVQNPILTFLEKQLEKTSLRLVALDSLNGTMVLGGETTAEIRVVLYNDLVDDATIDPRAIALRNARVAYSLDDLWNVDSTYTESNSKIVVIIGKYTDLTFVALDNSSPEKYVMTVDPSLYKIDTGLFLNPSA